MKKKVYAMIKNVLFVLFLSCCFFACNKAQSGTEPVAFKNFNVQETATAELKSYYVFEKPEVTVGEEKASVNVSVSYDGKTVPNNGVKVYLEHTGKYSVCYTAAYKDSFESKTTELTVSDTVAPVLAFDFPKYTDYGVSVALEDYCKVIDATAVKSVVYSAKNAETDTELDESQFDKTNRLLTVTDTAVKKVAITATATDVNGYESTQTVETQMLVPDEVGTVGVEYIEYYGSAVGEIALEDDQTQGKVVEWTTQVPSGGFYTYWVKHSKFAEFTNYDYIDITLKVEIEEESTKNALVYLGAREYTRLASGTYCGVSSLAEWSTITYSKTVAVKHNSVAFESFAQGQIGFSLKNNDSNNSFKGKVYIAEIRGRYADISSDGTAINLTEKYEGIQSASFTPLGMSQEQTIDDLSAWVPATGALSFVVNKANQSPRTFTLSIVVTNKNKVGNVSATDIYLNGSAPGEKTLALDTLNNTAVAVWNVTIEGNSWAHLTVENDLYADFANYDYVDFLIKIVPAETNTSGNGYLYFNKKEYTKMWNGENVASVGYTTIQEWTTVTFRKADSEHNATAFGNFESKKAVSISLKNNNANAQKFTVYIAEISCRYADISSDGTAIDLTEKYEGIKSATITPFGETQAQTISDLSSWTPVEGTLSFTVAKDGCLDNSYTVNVTVGDPVGTVSAKTIAQKGTSSVLGATLTTETDATEGMVAVWNVTVEGNSWAHLTVENDLYADFANYDYVDFLIKIVPAETNTSENGFLYFNKKEYTKMWKGEGETPASVKYTTIQEWTTVTFKKTDSNHNTTAFENFASKKAVSISLKNNNTTAQEFKVYIAKISVR